MLQDEIIDLRDEYLKDISSIQCGQLSLECNWVTNQRNAKDLTKLWKSIILAIIMGDDVAFQYTLHTTLINPFVGSILPHLIQKSIEYLSFGCADDTLDRLLRFLKVIVQNYHCRDVANNEEYFNLANIFVCLLLGPIDIKAKLELIKAEEMNLETTELEENCNSNSAKGEVLTNGDDINKDQMKIDAEVKDELDGASNDTYSKLVVNPVALRIKKEVHHFDFGQGIKFEPSFNDMDFQEEAIFECEQSSDASNAKVNASNECDQKVKVNVTPTATATVTTAATATATATAMAIATATATATTTATATINECFSSFDAEMCNSRYTNDVSNLVGLMASKWGYFEHEIIYLLAKRLEIFFHEITTWSTAGENRQRVPVIPFVNLNFHLPRRLPVVVACNPCADCIGRCGIQRTDDLFRAYSVRRNTKLDITESQCKTDIAMCNILAFEIILKCSSILFQFAAIYIRGKKDLYFYEYMQEACGDALLPFMLFYSGESNMPTN